MKTAHALLHFASSRSALLVIDMQDEFVKPHWTPFWVPAATRIVSLIAGLVDSCRALEVPIIFTAFADTYRFLDRPKSGAFMPNRYPQIPHDPGWFRETRISAPLQPQADDILILKPSYGAFYDTPLETILKNLGRDTIVISGTLTNFCCGMTARQGYERGFQVVFGFWTWNRKPARAASTCSAGLETQPNEPLGQRLRGAVVAVDLGEVDIAARSRGQHHRQLMGWRGAEDAQLAILPLRRLRLHEQEVVGLGDHRDRAGCGGQSFGHRRAGRLGNEQLHDDGHRRRTDLSRGHVPPA